MTIRNLLKILDRHRDLMIGAFFVMVYMNVVVFAIRFSKNPVSIFTMTILVIAVIPVILILLFIRENREEKGRIEEPNAYADVMERFPSHLDDDLLGLKK